MKREVHVRTLFHYSDYREFLRDTYRAKKNANPHWSYKVWARQLGLKSAATLIMILNGQRHPGRVVFAALCHSLGLKDQEKEHFADLIRLQRSSKDTSLSVLFLEKIQRRLSSQGTKQILPEQFAAIAGWHHYAIRELVRVPEFREDVDWISRQFKFHLSDREILGAVRTLLKVGLLSRDTGEKLVVTDAHVSTQNDFSDEALKHFHEQALENAKASLRGTPPEEREISGTTFPIATRNILQAKELIRKFQNDLCDLLETTDGDSIYHLEVAFYPVAVASAN